MTHHIKEWDIPDCPKCNAEMKQISRFKDKPTPDHPFGTNKVCWWECPDCHTKSKEVPYITEDGKLNEECIYE